MKTFLVVNAVVLIASAVSFVAGLVLRPRVSALIAGLRAKFGV